MREDKRASLHTSVMYLALFLLAALAFTLWSFQRIPDHVILHINDKWRVHLVGEQNFEALQLQPGPLKIVKRDSANLWLTGTGTVNWQSHTIKVYKAAIYLDRHSFSKNASEPVVNILFYPDGAVQKGGFSSR